MIHTPDSDERGVGLTRTEVRSAAENDCIFYDHVMNHKLSYFLTLLVAFCGEIVLSERGLLPILYEGLFLALAPQLVVQELQSTERGEFFPSLSMISLLEASQLPHSMVLFFFCLESLFHQTYISQLISESQKFPRLPEELRYNWFTSISGDF
jgi:hypothetical protein